MRDPLQTYRRRIQRLVTALRSGKYRQGQRSLRQGYGRAKTYCCLGVACDLAKRAVQGKWTVDNEFVTSTSTDVNILPFSVELYYGFNKIKCNRFPRNPDVLIGPTLRENGLADLNDHGKTFAEIADLIEATYLKGGSHA